MTKYLILLLLIFIQVKTEIIKILSEDIKDYLDIAVEHIATTKAPSIGIPDIEVKDKIEFYAKEYRYDDWFYFENIEEAKKLLNWCYRNYSYKNEDKVIEWYYLKPPFGIIHLIKKDSKILENYFAK